MRIFVLLYLLFSTVFGLEGQEKLFECTQIFQERKSELLVELERIDEQRQALDALKTATDELLDKKEIALNKKEQEVNAKLDEITQKEASIKAMLEANEKALAEIKALKMDKVSQTYAKMKPGAAAGVLSALEAQEAATILTTLKPKTVGKILSKMDAKKASEITLLLTQNKSTKK